jgi:DNA end-binding protein Ku
MAAVVWKGFVSFGLVSFPVRLYAAARNKSVQFHMLHKKDLSRLKEVFYCREEDKPVDREDIVKGFEVAKDEYVVVDQDELNKIAPRTAKVMDILQFVKEDEFDPVYMDKSYHMVPDGEISKSYSLLLEVMKKQRQFAIAKVAMHNREHLAVLRPAEKEMMLHTMFFANEVQASPVNLGQTPKFSAKEIQLATQLIEALTEPFEPEKFHDEYEENVEKLIEQKRKGKAVKGTAFKRPAPVVNIVEALQRSLAANEKSSTPPKKARKSRSAA